LEDKAWVEFKTPLNKKELFQFCKDIEVLFRINPYLEIKLWEKLSDKNYRMHVINHSQIPEFELRTEFEKKISKNEIKLKYNTGIKSNTVFSINPEPNGSKLTIVENYHTDLNDSIENYLILVDKSLKKWAEEVQQFLIHWKRWCWFSPWRLYKLRIWLPMKPLARRVTDILLFVSAIEIILIAMGSVIYILFYK